VRSAFVPDLVQRAPRPASHASAIAGSIVQGGAAHSGDHGPASRAIAAATRSAFVAGLDRILWVAGIAALVGAVLTLILIRPRDFHGSPEQQRSSVRRGGPDPVLEEAR
jgi:hypothetical protein